VSLHPPLVLVCVEKTSTTLPAIEHSRGFTVNFLEAGRDDLSQHFASKDERKFDGISWRPATTPEAGPVLDSGIFASVECSVHQAVEAGDHWIFVGEVRSGALTPAPRPLVHWTRRYWKLAE
jgi:flavin reductase (DIM6/NTAB) family NADH-FMN oxidoreductase RutF